MLRTILIVSLAASILCSVHTTPAVAQSRMDLPNDFGIELLGKSGLYSFVYQRMLNNALAVEAGISAIGGGGDGNTDIFIFIPLGAKFYFVQKKGSPFITGGINILNASWDAGPFGEDNKTATFEYVGLGFEYRTDGGLLFRGTAYGLIAEGGFFIWPGLHIGYAF